MFGGGLDAERADHAHALAKRHGKRGIGAAAADQEHGRIARGIDVRHRHAPRRVEPAHHGRVQRAYAQGGADARQQAFRMIVAVREGNDVVRQARLGVDCDQRQIGFAGGDLLCQRIERGLVHA